MPMTSVVGPRAVLLELEQDPGQLAPPEQHVVRPFEREELGPAGDGHQRVAERQRRHERAQRGLGGRRVGLHQQGGGEVPRGLGPGARAAAAARGLPQGEDPDRRGLGSRRGAAQRLGVGAVELGVDFAADARGPGAHQWKSVAAAAPAIASTPKRLTTPSTMASAEAPSRPQCSIGIWPSSPSTGSPKYIR